MINRYDDTVHVYIYVVVAVFFLCFSFYVLHLFSTLLSCFLRALLFETQSNHTCVETLTMIYEIECAIFLRENFISFEFFTLNPILFSPLFVLLYSLFFFLPKIHFISDVKSDLLHRDISLENPKKNEQTVMHRSHFHNMWKSICTENSEVKNE